MIDPWEKAAECEQAIRACADAERKLILENLRDLWVSIGNEKAVGMSDWGTQAALAAELHAEIIKSAQRPPPAG